MGVYFTNICKYEAFSDGCLELCFSKEWKGSV